MIKLPIHRALLISLAIHILGLAAIIYVPQTKIFMIMFGQPGKGQFAGLGDDNFDRFIDLMPIEVSVNVEEKLVQSKKILADKNEKSDITVPNEDFDLAQPTEDCLKEASFGGIGVKFKAVTNKGLIVDSIPSFYPAFKAGVRLGDKLITDITKIRGEIGTMVDVTFERNGQPQTISIRREKICYAKKAQAVSQKK